MSRFERIIDAMDKSIMRIGLHQHLDNESAVHEYVRPVIPLYIIATCQLYLPNLYLDIQFRLGLFRRLYCQCS